MLLLLGSAGCGGDESPGAEGVDGHNVRVDDTGRDDTADGGGWLLVVPAERAGRTRRCRVPPQGSAYGCDVIDLPASGELVTSFGEGGFIARLQDH